MIGENGYYCAPLSPEERRECEELYAELAEMRREIRIIIRTIVDIGVQQEYEPGLADVERFLKDPT